MHWLESGHGTYWISGKAGSGKSTLMNLICQDPRTNAALKVWSGSSEVLLPKFFFWNAGTELQKSSRGLLRSIIYQIMEKTPELMPVLEGYMHTDQQRTQQLPTWTERRLLATLQYLLRYGLQSSRLCIFVDGLDEFSGYQDDLLELIRDFRQYSNIKICLSSRPYRLFRDEFGSSAMLKLQELTELDIREYVSNKLQGARCETSQALDSSPIVDQIADKIVRRAEGVFLWVKLAVRDQLEGIRNYDNANQLLERLDILPDEIEGIYLHMLQKIDKVYWKEVAYYFYFVLNIRDSSLFNIALAAYDRIDDILLFSPGVSLSEICRHCRLIRERIATTCQGILEVCETDRHEHRILASFKSLEDQIQIPERRRDLIELKYYQECSWVDFLHRTAFDFFKDNVQARQFLDASAFVSPHLPILHVKVLLADLVVFPLPTDISDIRDSIGTIMVFAGVAEDETKLAQPALMGLLERSLSILYQRLRGHSSTVGYPEVPNSWREDGLLSITPTNFIGLAASFGLGLYVSCIIDSQSDPRTCSTTDYLLGCALLGPNYILRGRYVKHDMKYPSPNLKLIRALLERGANPQMKTPKDTVWILFLEKLWEDLNDQAAFSTGGQADWGTTVQAFLARGANCNETRNYAMNVRDDLNPAFVKGLQVPTIWLHLSPLTVLRLSFDNGPLLSQLEDAFIASGASVCSESRRITVRTRDNDYQQRPNIDFKLSQKQWDDFTDALKRRPKGEDRSELREYNTKVIREMDLQQLYDQARREEALEEQTIQEKESGEDEVNTDDEDTSDEWSTESSDSSDVEIEESTRSSQSPSQSPPQSP